MYSYLRALPLPFRSRPSANAAVVGRARPLQCVVASRACEMIRKKCSPLLIIVPRVILFGHCPSPFSRRLCNLVPKQIYYASVTLCNRHSGNSGRGSLLTQWEKRTSCKLYAFSGMHVISRLCLHSRFSTLATDLTCHCYAFADGVDCE